MPNDVCMTIKVAMGEVEKRLNDGPTAAEELVLDQQMGKLKALWTINGCGGGIDWEGLAIAPPTDDEINRVSQLMEEAGVTTVRAMKADAIQSAVIRVVQAAGGSIGT